MILENINESTATVSYKGDLKQYGKVITVDFGKRPKDFMKQVQLVFTLETQEEKDRKYAYVNASCGCTTPDLTNDGDDVQVLTMGLKTKTLGHYSKQVTLYDEAKMTTQIIRLVGENI